MKKYHLRKTDISLALGPQIINTEKMKKSTLFLLTFLLSGLLANAQITIDQISRYGNSTEQSPTGMCISNSNLYIAGSDAGQTMILKFGTENLNMLVWNIKWPNITSPGSEILGGVAVDANGVYASGGSYSQTTDASGDKEQKSIVCKFSLNGATGSGIGGADWITKPTFFAYQGTEHYYGNLINTENATNYIYSYGIAQENGNNSTAVLTKHDTNGNLIWIEVIGDTSSGVQNVSNAICILKDKLYLGGSEDHFTLWKSDLAGNKIWSKSTETSVISSMNGLCASDKYLFAAGYEENAGRGKDAVIIKYDENGNVIWKKVWGGSLEDIANGIEFLDNTLWVVGETSSYGAGGKDAFILKLNAVNGMVEDSVFYGGTQDDAAIKILKDGQAIFICGTFKGSATFGCSTLTSDGDKDLFLIKMKSATSLQAIPVTADANTVILDHFNATTLGEIVGTEKYVPSVTGLSQAIEFSKRGNFVIYNKSVNLESAGTVEMWVYPKTYSRGLLDINWNYSKTDPPSGHVFHLQLDSVGKVFLSNWGSSVSNSFHGNARIPLNSWTHLAVAWGDSTKIYINGKLDMASSLLLRPAISPQGYFYLPYWGDSTSYFDEFHVSNVMRTPAEIASRVLSVRGHTISTDSITIVAGKSITLPINTSFIDCSDAVISYQFNLDYDTTKLEFESYSKVGTLSQNGVVNINQSVKGILKIGYIGTEIFTGEGTLLNLQFKAINIGRTIPVLAKFLFNTDTVRSISNGAIRIFARYGDVDGNEHIQAYDAALVLQNSVGLDPMPSIDPIPWSSWRIETADVDGNGILSANDAGLILQKSIDLITTFPTEGLNALLRSAIVNDADVTVVQEGNNLVFKSYGELIGLNVTLAENFGSLGTPLILNNTMMKATNINASSYKIGLATATSPVEGTTFMTIPILDASAKEITIKLNVNATEKLIRANIVTGIISITNNRIQVYPNPVKEILTINLGSMTLNGHTIRIINLLGQTVYASPIKSAQTNIQMKDFPSAGMFNLLVIDGEKNIILSKKILKQ